jgi:hypothetical protein
MSFYQDWAEEAASLLTFRDQYEPEAFEYHAQKLVEKWEKYPPHAQGIKEMGEQWSDGFDGSAICHHTKD